MTPTLQAKTGYGSPTNVAQRIREWLGRYAGENSASLLLYEAMKALDSIGATATAAQVKLPYPDLEGLRRKLLAPREIVRDADGWLTHPAYPLHDEDVRADKLLDAFGIETSFVSMEYDDSDAHDRYLEAEVSDCSYWTPTRPDGDGWMLIEIYDTEDGPAAMFARERPKDKPLSRRERIAACQQQSSEAGGERKLSDAARDVFLERVRQQSVEGWTPEHDDEHRDYAMSCAAGCYAMHTLAYPAGDPPPQWPWAAEWWKPKDHRNNLVRAGALILAEIERLDRAANTAAITAGNAENSHA